MDYKNFSWQYISSILVLISAFVVVSFNNSYGQLLKIGLEELTKNSHTVIKGNVINQWSEFEENSKDIITITEFNVKETIKGHFQKTKRIITPGGIVGEDGLIVSHTPQFILGEEVIIFISDDYKGRQTVTGWIQGKFKIINERIFFENEEVQAEDFVQSLKNFIRNNENGLIEINFNLQSENPEAGGVVPTISNIIPNSGPALRPYAINPSDAFNPGERGTIIDIYGSNFGWDYYSVYTQVGQYINPYESSNPLHYLMYITAQMADHFGSNGPYEGEAIILSVVILPQKKFHF